MPQSIGAIAVLLYLIVLLGIIGLAAWRLFNAPRCHPPATRLHLYLKRNCNLALPGTTQLLTVTANGDGIETNVAVTSSDESIATVSQLSDTTFQVSYLAAGHVTFTGTALNSAGNTISGSVDADVSLPAADALTLTLSDN